MVKLDAPQYEIVKKYTELLDTIEEGLDYVKGSFDNLERTEGDRVLADIFTAFSKINDTNQQLLDIFSRNEIVRNQVNQFPGVIAECVKLEQHFSNQTEKQAIISKNIIPAFLAWKEPIQHTFSSYIQQ
ncbi:hypothetical protein [Cytobacillus sp. IB215665]|uniref:hypothetical protein n=1 Tax=Cytobacillus sp. IB215665 TaxID=3097357 RepID=UPI002A0F46DE|nr:hypothetical protein [Cytobacillus sp. IB215665]MDX8363830.1 hypothetical protein [Cytobacillus sp. IB215665]